MTPEEQASRSQESVMCDFCGNKTARIRCINQVFKKEEELLLVMDIPSVKCSHCGESYLTSQTLRELDCIKSTHENMVMQTIGVINFPGDIGKN